MRWLVDTLSLLIVVLGVLAAVALLMALLGYLILAGQHVWAEVLR